MKKIYFVITALVLCCLAGNAQNVNLQVKITQLQRTSYVDCAGCGNPDPTWIVQGTHNGQGALTYGPNCFHYADMASTIWDNPDYLLMNIVNTNATSFTVGLTDAFEKSCSNNNCTYESYNFFTCFPSVNGDSRRCQNINLVNENFRTYAPCQWHTFWSQQCGDYSIEYSFYWSFNYAPQLVTQPTANTNACLGNITTLNVAAANDANGWNTGRNFQWQVSNSTACPGTNWTDIPSATSATYVAPQIPGTRLYRCKVTSNCTANFTSNTTISNCAVVTYNPMGSPGDAPPDIVSGICGSSVLPGSTHTLGVLTAPNPGAPIGLSGYTWTASGGSPTTGNLANFVWTAPVNPGTYIINLTYNDNCPQADAAANACVVNVGSPTCDFAYVAPYGVDSVYSGGPDNPYQSLYYALTQLNGRKYIRMATGAYPEANPIPLATGITIEGGYKVNGNIWTKTNADSTTIIGFGTQVIDGNTAHRVGFISDGASNWTLQDLVITTVAISSTTANNRGYSNYGVLAINGSSNFELVRCKVYAGNAAKGISGLTPGGSGGAGGGGNGGNGGGGSNTRCNGSGSGGSNGAAGNGGASGGLAGGGCSGSGCNFANCNASGCSGDNGIDGSSGSAGSAYSAGSRPATPAAASPYYVPAGVAATGGNGTGGGGGGGGGGGDIGTCCTCTCGSGGTPNGGAGGSGGGGGLGGNGGYGGGGSFGLYVAGAGSSGTITTSLIIAGNAGNGGDGANGQNGGIGANGAGGINHGGCDGGIGGDGGRGGNGGNGGRGQDGANGLSQSIITVGGASLTGSSTFVPNAATISVDYQNAKACINSEIGLTKSTGVWSFAAGLNYENDQRDYPAGFPISSYSASSSPVVVYTTTPSVDYDLTVNGFIYAKYLKIAADNRSLPAITASANTICQDGVDTLTASHWGTETEYDWRIYQGTNVNNPLYQSTVPSPAINFYGFAPGLYTIRYRVRETCCGWSKAVFDTIRILPPPAPYNVAGGGNYCPGTAGAPITLSGSEPGVTYVLLYGGVPVDTVAGTGGPLNFDWQTGVGNYTVIAIRFTGCDAQMFGSVDIGQYPQPQAFNVTGSDTICQSGINSTGTVTISGSELGVNYQLYKNTVIPIGPALPGTGSALAFTGINAPGVYTVKGTSTISGCQTLMNDSALILIAPPPTSFNLTGGGSYCSGDSGVVIGLSGSDSGAVYQLLQNGVVPQATITGNGAAISFGLVTTPGYYKVKAWSIYGCEGWVADSVTVTVLANPQILAVNTTDVDCYNGSSGSITIIATSANGNLSYSIDSALNFSAGNVFSPLSGGNYHVVVRDAQGCKTRYAANPVTVKEPDALQILIESLDSIYCANSTNGAVNINVFGGTPPYTYNWTNGSTFEDINHLEAGTYTVNVNDAHNCNATLSVTLPAVPNPLAVVTVPVNVKCFKGSDGRVTVSVSGGEAPYQYYLNGVYQTDSIYTNLTAGNYSLVAYDNNGCVASANFIITEPQAFSVNAGTDIVSVPGQPIQLNANASSVNGIIGYIWSPDQHLSCTACQSPVARPDSTIEYVVMAIDGDSCVGYDSLLVIVKGSGYFIPSAFTPNNDKLNDYFEFDILGAENVEVSVFNRWGQRVYFNPAQHNGILNAGDAWDGTVDGKPVNYDTYVYQLRVKYYTGRGEDLSGTITLMK